MRGNVLKVHLRLEQSCKQVLFGHIVGGSVCAAVFYSTVICDPLFWSLQLIEVFQDRSVISGRRALGEPDESAIYCVYISHLLLGWWENLSAAFMKWRTRRTSERTGPPIISD